MILSQSGSVPAGIGGDARCHSVATFKSMNIFEIASLSCVFVAIFTSSFGFGQK